MYSHIKKAWDTPKDSYVHSLMRERLPKWNKEESIVRLERPTRVDRARKLGYKAKQGIVVVRSRIRRGGRRKSRVNSGRVPKKMGVNKITPGKSLQRIAEERVQRKFPNMVVLNSYWVGETGKAKYYEVILVDPEHPVILSDKNLNWVARGPNRSRSLRGLTSAGKKGRGLRNRGKGAEKIRPSIRANKGRGK